MLIAKMEFSFYHSEDNATTKMRFNFTAKNRVAKDGYWDAADPTSKKLSSIYLGDTAGWWQVHSEKKGPGQFIAMLEHKLETGIAAIWTSFPDAIALVGNVPKLPFQLGNFGDGSQWAQPGLRFSWTVVGT